MLANSTKRKSNTNCHTTQYYIIVYLSILCLSWPWDGSRCLYMLLATHKQEQTAYSMNGEEPETSRLFFEQEMCSFMTAL